MGPEPKEKRKALLDGILFEIFFDAHGLLRKKIKGRMFNEVFDLQRYNDLQSSFDFIAEALTAARVDLYVVPRANHDLAVCVSTTKGKAGLIVDAIYVDGVNVLRPEEDALDTGDGNPLYEQIDAEQLTQKLSEEMIVPVRALKITYTMPEAANVDEFWFPKDWTTRKT